MKPTNRSILTAIAQASGQERETLLRSRDKKPRSLQTATRYLASIKVLQQIMQSNGNNLKPECREAILQEVKGTVQGVLEVYVRYLSEYLTKVIRYYGLRLNPNEVMQSLL